MHCVYNQVLNGPAFVSIVMTMFQAFGCSLTNMKGDDDGEEDDFRFVLIEDTEMVFVHIPYQ